MPEALLVRWFCIARCIACRLLRPSLCSPCLCALHLAIVVTVGTLELALDPTVHKHITFLREERQHRAPHALPLFRRAPRDPRQLRIISRYRLARAPVVHQQQHVGAVFSRLEVGRVSQIVAHIERHESIWPAHRITTSMFKTAFIRRAFSLNSGVSTPLLSATTRRPFSK